MSKPLTAAKVRSVLRQAGYDCAKSHTTNVRGWRSWSPGFLVRDGGKIIVEYKDYLPPRDRVRAWLERYRVALVAAGLAVTDGPHDSLFVVALELSDLRAVLAIVPATDPDAWIKLRAGEDDRIAALQKFCRERTESTK